MIKLKIFTTFLTAIVISGCNTPNPISKPLTSDKTLKTVKRIQTISDTTAIAFEWLPFSELPRVVGYKIYRMKFLGDESDEKLKLIATINEKITSHYVDTDLKPNTTYKYRFTIFTDDGRESLGSKPIIARTKKLVKPIHYIIPVGDLANKAKLIWRPHQNSRVSGYIIERNDIYSQSWKRVGELTNRLNVEFIDRELKTNKTYKYRIRVKTFNGLISEPSKVVEVSTKALPKPVVDITASSELPKEIKINWRTSDEVGIRGYRIYSSETNRGDFELIAEVKDSKYLDQIMEDGKQMFYKVSTIDKTGLESIQNELPVMGNSLFKPKPPKIIKLEASEIDISINWQPTDPRTLRYKLIKKSGSGWSKSDEIIIDVDKNGYLDSNVVVNVNYSYQVIAIDKFGIESIATEENEISLKGSK